MFQICFVSDEHDDHLAVAVLAQLFEPFLHVHVRVVLGDVVDEKSSYCAAIKRARDRSESLLTGRVPHLSFDLFRLNFYSPARFNGMESIDIKL